MDRESFAVRCLGPVDARAARALRAGEVEADFEPVGDDADFIAARFAQLELRLELSVDDEKEFHVAGIR